MIEYFRLTIEYLRFASGGSIFKRPMKNDGATRGASACAARAITLVEIRYSIFMIRYSIFLASYQSFFLDQTGRFSGQRRCSCETTHNWNGEPQNIEQEISNDEVWIRYTQSI